MLVEYASTYFNLNASELMTEGKTLIPRLNPNALT